jgi:YYY domain-containing protein
MLQALGFFAFVEVVGLAAAPLAGLALGRLPGAGLGLAKPLGLLLLAWLVWMAASLGVAPYSPGLIAGALVVLIAAGALAALRLRGLTRRLGEARPPRGPFGRWRRERLAARALEPDDPLRRPLFLGAEAVFAAGFVLVAVLVAFAPDVWGTEKPMDMAFMTAIDAADSFPPNDPWMAGEDLNYYYLGHLVAALPMGLLGGAPDESYNLALAVLFGLSAAAVFTFGATLWAAARIEVRGGPVGAGLAAVALCLVLGNLAGAKAWIDASEPPRDYDWFAPSRVIEDGIAEFPWFSFNLGDVHAHVLAIPFTFLALAFALQVVLTGPRGDVVLRGAAEALAAGLAIGALYAINAWSYPVVAGLLVLAAAAWMLDPASAGRRVYAGLWTGLVVLASVVLLLPFWLEFDPAADGVALVGERGSFSDWAGDAALVFGVLAWPAAAAYASRVLAARRPARVAIWGGVALLFVGSLLAPVDLTQVAGLAAALAVALHAALRSRLAAAERFLWLLLAGGVTCLLLPEVVYVRDSFAGGPLYRMNTIFKMGYQAWLLLAVAAACALPWAGLWLPRSAWAPWAAVAAVLALLGLVYPYAGTYARRDGFSRSPTLDGLGWLRDRAPGDVLAIDWLREHAPPDAVVLEAVGDDYSAFGHARISTFTGRPAVMGWEGHEVQWDHDPGSRRADVDRLYRTRSVAEARRLLAPYRVRYVVAGPIERTDHGDAGLAKWDRLGRRVLDREGTTVWELATPAAP